MDTVIGHDCHGRPLRVGDKCVLLAPPGLQDHWANGAICSVYGASPITPGDIEIDIPHREITGWHYDVRPNQIRKLYDGDQPADESFEDMMSRLNNQDMTKRNKELVFKF